MLFLELLYHIARQLRDADSIRSEMVLQKDRTARLSPVLEYVERNYADSITLREAAVLAKMSVPQFVRLFKKVAGMSLRFLTGAAAAAGIAMINTVGNVAGFAAGYYRSSQRLDRRLRTRCLTVGIPCAAD